MTTIEHSILGPYTPTTDVARLFYGRLLWKKPHMRERLLRHWSDPRHPYSHRFTTEFRPLVEQVLAANEANDATLDEELKADGSSLRAIVREIPPVIGALFK